MRYSGDVISGFLEGAEAAGQLQEWVYAYTLREHLFAPGDRVLVAVSGGPDSVALLHLLYRLRRQLGLAALAMAHFNHGLRPEAAAEAAFVADLAATLSLPFYGGAGAVRDLARAKKISLQMAARKLRLAFLQETRQRHDYQRVALAHTANDQVELFFLRLLRGAGLEGLGGMRPVTEQGLVRPLLSVGKTPLLAWLKQEGLAYRLDASNRSRAYLRNRVRLDLMPHLTKSYNPRLGQTIWRTQELLRTDAALLAPPTEQVWSRVATRVGEGVISLDLPGLLALEAGWQARLLRLTAGKIGAETTLTISQVASLLDLAHGRRSGGLIPLGAGAAAARAGAKLHFFQTLGLPPVDVALPLPEPPGELAGPDGWRWSVAFVERGEEDVWPPEAAWLNPARLPVPLEVRYGRPGDRFWPQGAPGAKKLQDFLVNCRVPRWLRPHLPLVAHGRDIIWVPGLRLAEPLKVSPGSRRVLEIKITPVTPEARRLLYLLAQIRQRRL